MQEHIKYWNFKSVFKAAFKEDNCLFSNVSQFAFIFLRRIIQMISAHVPFCLLGFHHPASCFNPSWRCYCSLALPHLGALNHVYECYDSINFHFGKWTLSWEHLDLIYSWSVMAVYNCWRPNPFNQLPINLPSESRNPAQSCLGKTVSLQMKLIMFHSILAVKQHVWLYCVS